MIRCPELLAAALAGCLAAAAPAAARESPPAAELAPSDARLKRLGEHFFASAQYYRAVGAFEELALFTRDPGVARQARLGVALSFHRGLQIDEAVRAYDQLVADRGLDAGTTGWLRLLRVLARIEGSWRALRLVPPEDLLAELSPLEGHEGAPYQIVAGYHLSRLHLVLGDHPRAREVLARSQSRCRARDHAGRAGCAPLEALAQPLAWTTPDRGSPLAGALLSAVVPGLGALYARRPFDALYYFLLTTGSGLLAWDVHEPGRGPGAQKASFYVLSGIAATFYLSSVVQGWLGVERSNEVAEYERRQRILRATERPLPDTIAELGLLR